MSTEFHSFFGIKNQPEHLPSNSCVQLPRGQYFISVCNSEFKTAVCLGTAFFVSASLEAHYLWTWINVCPQIWGETMPLCEMLSSFLCSSLGKHQLLILKLNIFSLQLLGPRVFAFITFPLSSKRGNLCR